MLSGIWQAEEVSILQCLTDPPGLRIQLTSSTNSPETAKVGVFMTAIHQQSCRTLRLKSRSALLSWHRLEKTQFDIISVIALQLPLQCS